MFINLSGFLLTIYCTFSSLRRFLVSNFSQTGIEPFQLGNFFPKLLIGALISTQQKFLIFYGFLHCWHNLFAELLRFGDRQFYTNWWSSTSISQYFRTWNIIVQDWLYFYIYLPIIRLTRNKTLSNYAVMLLSAIFHEYIIAGSMGFVFPVLFLSFAFVGCKCKKNV